MTAMQRIALFATLALASGLALAQNVAVVNGKPIPKTREDAWVKELTKQGQKDTPELRTMVKERLIQNEVLLQEASKRGIADKPCPNLRSKISSGICRLSRAIGSFASGCVSTSAPRRATSTTRSACRKQSCVHALSALSP